MKTEVQRFRLTPLLMEKVRAESERLGMNISEFLRYVLTLFFYDRMDRSPHNVDRRLVDPGAEYATKER